MQTIFVFSCTGCLLLALLTSPNQPKPEPRPVKFRTPAPELRPLPAPVYQTGKVVWL